MENDMAAELEAPVMAAAGSSRKDKERLRQKKRRLDPAVRTEENRKRMWRHYKKHHGTLGYGAWKSAGEPACAPAAIGLGLKTRNSNWCTPWNSNSNYHSPSQ